MLLIVLALVGGLIYLSNIHDKKKVEGLIKTIKIILLVLGIGSIFLSVIVREMEPVWMGLAFLVVIPIFNAYEKWKKKPAPVGEGKSTDHGSAEWASNEQTLAVLGSQDFGLHIGAGYLWKKSGHLMSIAGSGKGKGTCLIIPSLLVDPFGSYVVTDPKGENAFITARYQKEAGQNVYIIDPWEEQKKLGATHGISSSGFNPFSFLKNDPNELRDNCDQIATFLIPDNPNAKDPYWNDRARSLIKVLLMHIVTAKPAAEHNFWTLYKMLRLSGDNWYNLLFDIKENQAEDGLISIAAEELIGITKAGTTLAGIMSSAQNATTIFESPQLRRSLENDDFNPYSLPDGKSTVYIVIPERFLETHSSWLRLMIGLLLKACNARPKNRVNFILDEFAVLGKMVDIQKAYAFARGQNIVMWTFVQNLSALKQIYGEDGMNSFIGNSAIFQVFGVKDFYTTEYVSKMLGETTQTKMQESFNLNGKEKASAATVSFQTYNRRLLTPDEVETNTSIITIVNGLRTQIPRMPYFENWVENMTEEQAEEFNKLQLMENKIRVWYHLFKKRADAPPRVLN